MSEEIGQLFRSYTVSPFYPRVCSDRKQCADWRPYYKRQRSETGYFARAWSDFSQPPFNVPNALANPTLELRDGSGAIITSNDNWGDAANKQAISDSGYAPPNNLESAILTSLDPGNYTAIVRGVNNTTYQVRLTTRHAFVKKPGFVRQQVCRLVTLRL